MMSGYTKMAIGMVPIIVVMERQDKGRKQKEY
jgi:hypothetical protein